MTDILLLTTSTYRTKCRVKGYYRHVQSPRWREIWPSCHWSIIMQRHPSSQQGTSDLPSEQGDPASQSGTIGLDTFYRRAFHTEYCCCYEVLL